MEEDWDNLFILDACRYDMFQNMNTINGNLSYRISLGSATREFLNRNFTDKTHHDTVYVTANPMYRVLGLNNVFFDVIDVWDDHWDDNLNTVLPSSMVKETIRAAEMYPNKRIISQFMQPHYPFIGELGEKIGEQAGFAFMLVWTTDKEGGPTSKTVWELVEDGEITHELARDAYYENLELALPHVHDLITSLDGKSVVTSDHGNLLGERPFPFASRVYGHPVGVHCDALCKVPWLSVDAESRREIVEETPVDQTAKMTEDVTERLADLGYVDL